MVEGLPPNAPARHTNNSRATTRRDFGKDAESIEMILPGRKGSGPKPAVEKRESSTAKKTPRSRESAGEKQTRAEKTTGSKLPGSRPLDTSLTNYFGKDLNDPRAQLNLLELVPRDAAQETSEGIQVLIKALSDFIEMKNPFQEKQAVACPSSRSEATRPVDKAAEREKATTPRANLKRVTEKPEKSPSSEPARTTPKEKKPKSGGKIRKESKTEPPGKPREAPAQEPLSKNGAEVPEGGRVAGKTEKRRVRPSEIPLRKTGPRRIKPVALLMQKSLQEDNSNVSIDCYRVKKTFSPIEECSVDSVRGSFCTLDKTSDKNIQSSSYREKHADIEELKLGRRCKSSNICLQTEASAYDLSREEERGRRSKLLDLHEVTSSSFALLPSTSITLHRLESLHQQNVSAKENALANSRKELGTKLSFSGLTSRELKKGKANKLAAKHKEKKEESSPKASRQSSRRTPHLDIYREIIAAGKVGNLSLVPRVECSPEPEERARKKAGAARGKHAATSEKKTRTPRRTRSKPEVSEPPKSAHERRQTRPKGAASAGKEPPEFSEKSCLPSRALMELMAPSTPPPTPPTTPEEQLPKLDVDYQVPTASKTFIIEPADGKGKDKPPSRGREPAGKQKTRSSRPRRDEDAKAPESEKVKLQIKIEIKPESPTTECVDGVPEAPREKSSSHDLLFSSSGRASPKEPQARDGPDETPPESPGVVAPPAEAKPEPRTETPEPKIRRSCKSSYLKPRLRCKMSAVNLKKKQMQSDAGDRWFLSPSGSFNSSLPLKKKPKPDTKLRSGLTKSRTRDGKASRERKSLLDEANIIKLRRRNSEPYSCRGFVWKHADPVVCKGTRASVSSMASSLRHLNTDELDDFIFWEAVPQMTSCWEMSLYHFKKPWSLLSCSVFDDNRQSSTPGRILDNLRNGRNLGIRSVASQIQSIIPQKETDFDVEPSIAQKNIDIRNWLSALNFPAPPSTSSDIIGESDGRIEGASAHSIKVQGSSRGRTVVPRLTFSEEIADGQLAALPKNADKWRSGEMGDLMELIRRKSGGFITSQQFFSSEPPLLPQTATINFCTCTRALKDEAAVAPEGIQSPGAAAAAAAATAAATPPEQKADRGVAETPRKEPEVGEPEDEAPPSVAQGLKPLGPEGPALAPELNVWKYLFLITLLVIFVYFSTGRSRVCV